MAAWLTVYCARSVASITAGDLLSFLKDLEDPWTLAETYGLDDDKAVDRAMANLRVERVTEPSGVKFAVYYKPGNSRPIHIHVWTGDRLAEEVEEARELLATVKGTQVRVSARASRSPSKSSDWNWASVSWKTPVSCSPDKSRSSSWARATA